MVEGHTPERKSSSSRKIRSSGSKSSSKASRRASADHTGGATTGSSSVRSSRSHKDNGHHIDEQAPFGKSEGRTRSSRHSSGSSKGRKSRSSASRSSGTAPPAVIGAEGGTEESPTTVIDEVDSATRNALLESLDAEAPSNELPGQMSGRISPRKHLTSRPGWDTATTRSGFSTSSHGDVFEPFPPSAPSEDGDRTSASYTPSQFSSRRGSVISKRSSVTSSVYDVFNCEDVSVDDSDSRFGGSDVFAPSVHSTQSAPRGTWGRGQGGRLSSVSSLMSRDSSMAAYAGADPTRPPDLSMADDPLHRRYRRHANGAQTPPVREVSSFDENDENPPGKRPEGYYNDGVEGNSVSNRSLSRRPFVDPDEDISPTGKPTSFRGNRSSRRMIPDVDDDISSSKRSSRRLRKSRKQEEEDESFSKSTSNDMGPERRPSTHSDGSNEQSPRSKRDITRASRSNKGEKTRSGSKDDLGSPPASKRDIGVESWSGSKADLGDDSRAGSKKDLGSTRSESNGEIDGGSRSGSRAESASLRREDNGSGSNLLGDRSEPSSSMMRKRISRRHRSGMYRKGGEKSSGALGEGGEERPNLLRRESFRRRSSVKNLRRSNTKRTVLKRNGRMESSRRLSSGSSLTDSDREGDGSRRKKDEGALDDLDEGENEEPEKYALDSRSRYFLDVSDAKSRRKREKSFSGMGDEAETNGAPADDTLKSGETCTDLHTSEGIPEEDDDDVTIDSATEAFAKTMSLAAAVVSKSKNEANASADQGKEKEAFQQFLLLSINPEDVEANTDIDSWTQEGPNFSDPFCFRVADVLDIYPPQKEGQKDDTFDLEALSPFCFPNGVRVRLVPRVALPRAKELGLYGSYVDRYLPLVFTDGSGVISHGVAITIREEVICPHLVEFLVDFRDQRRAALKLTLWYRKLLETHRANTRFTRNMTIDGMNKVHAGGGGNDDGMSDNESVLSRSSFASFRFPRRNSFSSLSEFLGGGQHKTKPSKKKPDDKKGKKGTKKKKKGSEQTGVSDVLDEFLRTSPIPKYDAKTKTGVWRSAKLRVSKKTNQCMVVIRHALLKGDTGGTDGGAFDYTGHFEDEKNRLIDMLKDAPVPLPGKGEGSSSKARSLHVTSICFEELDEATGTKKKTTTLTKNSPPPPEEEVEEDPRVRERVLESLEHMNYVERVGEACVVEKCFVLMGGKPREQALLLVALQQIVNSERKDHAARAARLSKAILSVCEGDEQGENDPIDVMEEHAELAAKDKNKEISLRHNLLSIVQVQATLSERQEAVSFPKTEIGHVFGKREKFQMKLPIHGVESIKLPLPLPQIAGEWGLATLLLRIGVVELMKVLKLLLLERSVLVLGVSSEEVTACACTLLELLKPYEWASPFLPLLPSSMLDFIHSPVPFVAGMAASGEEEMKWIETDERVTEALEDGMSILNLTKGSVSMTLGCGEDQILVVPTRLSDALGGLEKRLTSLVKHNSSSVGSMQSFVQHGLTPKESVTIRSMQQYIQRYMKSLPGDLATEADAWRRYGKYNEHNDGYDFYPALFLNPLRAELQFLEEMAHTQMFIGFVDARRKAELKNEEKRREAGEFIADWVEAKWTDRQIQRTSDEMNG